MLGKRIKKLRKIRGWNQTQLADSCGLSLGSIKSIEAGRSSPRVVTLDGIAQALGVSTSILVDGLDSIGGADGVGAA